MAATVASPTIHALRVALAAVVSLFLVEYWGLEHGNLAVYSGFMASAQYNFTAFQKGVERVVGRGVGILTGLIVVLLGERAPMVGIAIEVIAIHVFFYISFAGRLAYTFLNAGLYLSVMTLVGRADPGSAVHEGRALFFAVALGVVVSDLVNWIGGAERKLAIDIGGEALLPIRRALVVRCFVLTATVLVTRLAAWWLQLSTSSAIVSVMVLSTAPDLHGLLVKGELRLLGALLGGAWGMGSFLLLNRLPHFPLLMALLFLGTYLAAYYSQTGGESAYAGLQMGLVLLMVLVVPPADFGSVTAAIERAEGIVVALAASVFVGGLWVGLRRPARPAVEPAKAHLPNS